MTLSTPLTALPLHSKILISTAERVGDALFCTPGIRLLKQYRPDLILDILTFNKAASALFDNNPDVNICYLSTSKRRIKQLAQHYPLVINMMYEFEKYLVNIKTKRVTIPLPDRTTHRMECVLDFVSSLTGEEIASSDKRYFLYPQTKDVKRIDSLLQQHHVNQEQDILIGCHLGCHRVARRRFRFWSKDRHQHRKVWPLENYVQLANQLKAAHPRIRLVITGSPNEKFLAKSFMKEVPWAINLISETSITEVTALMDKLAVYITHDTGTLHLACARGTPLVALFGPTPLAFTGPYPVEPHHKILRKDSMADISVGEVYSSVLDVLGR